MADLLLGVYTFGEHDQTFKGATTGRRWKMFRPYVQDDWRATPNLTLNLGFAWAVVTPIVEAQNRQANFVFDSNCSPQPTCNLLVPGQGSDSRVGIQLDKTAFEPRIGLSWKVLGSQTTVLRAGYAIFHDSSWNIGGQGLVNNPPFEASSALFPGFPGFTGTCPVPAFDTNPNAVLMCDLGRVSCWRKCKSVRSWCIYVSSEHQHVPRHRPVGEYQLQAGDDSAVQLERRASASRKHRADGRICGIA